MGVGGEPSDVSGNITGDTQTGDTRSPHTDNRIGKDGWLIGQQTLGATKVPRVRWPIGTDSQGKP